MDKRHNSGVAQYGGVRQLRFVFRQPRLFEAVFVRNVPARSAHRGNALGVYRVDYVENRCALFELREIEEEIELVVRVNAVGGNFLQAHGVERREGVGENLRVARARRAPFGQIRQAANAQNSLHLGHAHVRAESFEIPAEARGVLGVENQIVVAPVVFERPHFAPNRLAVRSDRAALAARGYDLS